MIARRAAISGAPGFGPAPAPGPATMEEPTAEVNVSVLTHSVAVDSSIIIEYESLSTVME